MKVVQSKGLIYSRQFLFKSLELIIEDSFRFSILSGFEQNPRTNWITVLYFNCYLKRFQSRKESTSEKSLKLV